MDKSEKRKKHHKSKESMDHNETENSLIEQLKTRITLGSEEVFNVSFSFIDCYADYV